MTRGETSSGVRSSHARVCAWTASMRSRFIASQRLKGSGSLAARKASSSGVRAASRMIGAAKPRLSESTGFSGRFPNTHCVRSAESSNMRVPATGASSSSASCTGISSPFEERKATGKGMRKGRLADWPGVAGVDCVAVRVRRWFTSSQAVRTVTRGVPACEYQSENCERSRPEASAIASRNASHVTARPSFVAMYLSKPLRKVSLPSRVWSMRITSAPFS